MAGKGKPLPYPSPGSWGGGVCRGCVGGVPGGGPGGWSGVGVCAELDGVMRFGRSKNLCRDVFLSLHLSHTPISRRNQP